MMNQIKMFSFDLDGTLLNDHKTLSDYTIQTCLELQEEGYRIILGSGRYFNEIERFAKILQLDKYHGYAVCGNGYEVIDIHNNTKHHFTLMEKEMTKHILKISNDCHLIQFIKINGVFHLSTNVIPKSGLNFIKNSASSLKKIIKKLSYASHLLDETIFDKDLGQYINEGIVKLCVIGFPNQINKWVNEINKTYPDTFAFYPINPFSIEITHKSVSKRNGVEYVANINNLTLENVMAFGDSGNDEPLLLNCGIGVTMKNGTKKALQKARYVTKYTNHEDGVVKTILEFKKK